MSDKVRRTYLIRKTSEEMLRRMSKEELRTLSTILDLAIAERYAARKSAKLVDTPVEYDAEGDNENRDD